MQIELELARLLKFSCTKINRNEFSSCCYVAAMLLLCCCYVIIKWLDGTDIKTDYKGIG